MTEEFDHLAIPAFLVADPSRAGAPLPDDHPIRIAAEAQRNERLAGRVVDHATQAFLDQQAAERKIKARNRIAKMLAKKECHKGERWSVRTARWEPIDQPAAKPAITGATDMNISAAKEMTYSKPADAARGAERILGHPVERGVDFETKPTPEGRIALVLKTGKNAIATKIANGQTEIERSYSASAHSIKVGEIDKAAPAAIKKAKAVAALASATKKATAVADISTAEGQKALAEHPIGKANAKSWDHLLGNSRKRARLAAEAKAGGKKPAKAPKAKKAAKPAKAAAKATSKPARAAKAPKSGESKVAVIAALLKHPEGTTTKEILAATGWPAVSVPQQAKSAGLTLRKEKVKGEPTRYFGE